ncbi:MAG: class I SAM-dependent methyltransferase [Streptosporangiaceae bacterium]
MTGPDPAGRADHAAPTEQADRVSQAGQDADELIAQAVAAPFAGWDFGWLNARSSVTALPWSYQDEVLRHAASASTMVDMGTGGGEILAALPGRPARTVATESWPPNVTVAADRLRPLGIPVLHTQGAPENMSAEADAEHAGTRPPAGRLPFRDGALDLVINRHESFSAREVARVLTPGGHFVTQQVDYHSDLELYDLLGLEPPGQPVSWLLQAVAQLSRAGLDVTVQRSGQSVLYLRDVGALVYYLKIVPWVVPQYGIREFLPRLRTVSMRRDAWPAPVTGHRFLIAVLQPARPAARMPSVGGGK